jgi:hypothetical protein
MAITITTSLGLALMVALGAQPAQPRAFRVGVAAPGEDGYCLSLLGAALPIGSPVTLVSTTPSQHVVYGTVRSATPKCEGIVSSDIAGPYYFLTTEEPIDAVADIWIVVPGRAQTRTAAGRVRVVLSPRWPNAQVRSCASSEGLHLTVWSGTPLRSTRLWHLYWYLGYDVASDCRPADYEGARAP